MDTQSLLLVEREEQAGGVDDGRDALFAVSDGVNGNGELASSAIPRRSHLGLRELVVRIEERIQYQTCNRVRNLVVNVTADDVVLRGRCATFYTKQLAQHAAMGVLEDEVLINDILVATTR